MRQELHSEVIDMIEWVKISIGINTPNPRPRPNVIVDRGVSVIG